MDTNKTKEAQKFLKSLEDPAQMMGVLNSRLPFEVLVEINNYAKLIADVKYKTTLTDADIVSCSIIIGYLLKGHMDRVELEERLNNI